MQVIPPDERPRRRAVRILDQPVALCALVLCVALFALGYVQLRGHGGGIEIVAPDSAVAAEAQQILGELDATQRLTRAPDTSERDAADEPAADSPTASTTSGVDAAAPADPGAGPAVSETEDGAAAEVLAATVARGDAETRDADGTPSDGTVLDGAGAIDDEAADADETGRSAEEIHGRGATRLNEAATVEPAPTAQPPAVADDAPEFDAAALESLNPAPTATALPATPTAIPTTRPTALPIVLPPPTGDSAGLLQEPPAIPTSTAIPPTSTPLPPPPTSTPIPLPTSTPLPPPPTSTPIPLPTSTPLPPPPTSTPIPPPPTPTTPPTVVIPYPVPVGAAAQTVSTGQAEANFVDAINGYRASLGLGSLRHDPSLSQIARAWSQEMARRNAIPHNPNLEGQLPGGWMNFAENVGMSNSTWEELHRAFLASPGHEANIRLAEANTVGIGVVYAGGNQFVTQIFATY